MKKWVESLGVKEIPSRNCNHVPAREFKFNKTKTFLTVYLVKSRWIDHTSSHPPSHTSYNNPFHILMIHPLNPSALTSLSHIISPPPFLTGGRISRICDTRHPTHPLDHRKRPHLPRPPHSDGWTISTGHEPPRHDPLHAPGETTPWLYLPNYYYFIIIIIIIIFLMFLPPCSLVS